MVFRAEVDDLVRREGEGEGEDFGAQFGGEGEEGEEGSVGSKGKGCVHVSYCRTWGIAMSFDVRI